MVTSRLQPYGPTSTNWVNPEDPPAALKTASRIEGGVVFDWVLSASKNQDATKLTLSMQ